MANDPDLAQAIADGIVDLPEERDAPSLAEWDGQTALLAAISDRLDSIVLAVMASAGAKSLPKLSPQPRPRTAIGEAVRARTENARLAATRALVSILTPEDRPAWLYRNN